jgi:predicted dehydrogenase
LLGQTLIEFDGAQASLSFDAVVKVGPFETAYVAGTKATLRSSGNVCGPQTVTLATPRGTASPTLEGNWFNDGFKGSMGELLTSIEKKREPVNSARDNLKSLAICFAAVASADSGKPVKVGSVRKVSKRCMVADE